MFNIILQYPKKIYGHHLSWLGYHVGSIFLVYRYGCLGAQWILVCGNHFIKYIIYSRFSSAVRCQRRYSLFNHHGVAR
jgi:hypothetical protein